MKQERTLEHLLEKHAPHKEVHKKLTKHLFLVLVACVALFGMSKLLPQMTGFVVSEGAPAAVDSGSRVTFLAGSQESKTYLQLYLSTLWIIAVGMLGMIQFERDVGRRHRNAKKK